MFVNCEEVFDVRGLLALLFCLVPRYDIFPGVLSMGFLPKWVIVVGWWLWWG